MFYELTFRDPFNYIPTTFHIKTGTQDPEWEKFEDYFQNKQKGLGDDINLWIIKPGENSNRGQGIEIADNLQEIKKIVNQKKYHKNGI